MINNREINISNDGELYLPKNASKILCAFDPLITCHPNCAAFTEERQQGLLTKLVCQRFNGSIGILQKK